MTADAQWGISSSPALSCSLCWQCWPMPLSLAHHADNAAKQSFTRPPLDPILNPILICEIEFPPHLQAHSRQVIIKSEKTTSLFSACQFEFNFFAFFHFSSLTPKKDKLQNIVMGVGIVYFCRFSSSNLNQWKKVICSSWSKFFFWNSQFQTYKSKKATKDGFRN